MTVTHRRTGTPEYITWINMRRRCRKMAPLKDRRVYYDAGIRVCSRWDKFEAFFEDMGVKPSERHTLDRIDGRKGYSKDNCRWVLRIEQNRNQKTNVKVMLGKVEMTLKEACQKLNLNYSTARSRITRSGVHPQDALALCGIGHLKGMKLQKGFK